MLDLSCENTMYDNLIEFYFHEYFEIRGIDISGNNYKEINNGSIWDSAFKYIYKKLFKPSNTDIRYNNKNTLIDLKNPNDIYNIYCIYEDIITDYCIIPYQYFFCHMTGISRDTINSWLHEEYKHEGLSNIYSDIAKKLQELPKNQLRNKLGYDRIGMQSLANNDDEIGLHYARNEARNKQEGIREAMQIADTKTAFEQFQIEQKSDTITAVNDT